METRLPYCSEKTKVKVLRINGGKGALQNFEQLGIQINDEITILNNRVNNGPIIVSLKEYETKIGRELAAKVVVETDEEISVSLDNLKIDDKCIVSNITAINSIRARLIDMGLIKGATLKVVRYAPLGDPIEVKLRGFNLSLRLEEAKCIQVQTTKIASNGNGNSWFSFGKSQN